MTLLELWERANVAFHNCAKDKEEKEVMFCFEGRLYDISSDNLRYDDINRCWVLEEA